MTASGAAPAPAPARPITGALIGLALTLAVNTIVLAALVLVTAHRPPPPPPVPTVRLTRAPAPPPPPAQLPGTPPAARAPVAAPAVPQPPLPTLATAALGDVDLALPPPPAEAAPVQVPQTMPAWSVSGARIAHRPEEYDQQQAPPDTAPRLIGDANLASYYPQDARQRGLTGDTALDLDIAADGTVTSAHVAGSTPPGVFDEAAERLSLRLRFQPATVAGRAVATTVLYRIHWTLNR